MSNETLWFAQALLPDGWAQGVKVTVEGGIIVGVEVVGGGKGAVVPGMHNVHSHGFQRALAGQGDSFWGWREIMYRYVARLTPEDVEAITALAYMEMLEGGFTRVGEFHYLHHDVDGRPYGDRAEMAKRVCAAAETAGIGLTLLPVFYAHSGFGGLPPGEGQKRFINDVDGFARLVEGIPGDVGLALHSLRAVTPGEMGEVLALGGGPVHIHIAEQEKEVADCLAWSGQRPVEWLLAHADVGPNWCLVHATHMNNNEKIGLAQSGAVAGLCPITEANLGDGVFPIEGYDGAFGIGSDSNVRIDACEELRWLEYGQRLFLKKRNIVKDLYGKALRGGAQALGVTSGIAVGCPADLVSLDLDHPGLVEKTGDELMEAWLFCAGKEAIDGVWRGGEKVVSGGKHCDRGAILGRFGRVLGRFRGDFG